MNGQEPGGLSLLDRLRFLSKDAVLYGSAAALNKAFALITFPLLARHFSVAEFGLFDFYSVFAGFLSVLFVFGQDSAVARFFYECTQEGERRELVSQSLVVQIACLVVCLPILFFGAEWIGRSFGPSGGTSQLTYLVLLQVPPLLVVSFAQNLLKWTFARARFLLLSLGIVLCTTVALLVGLWVFRVKIVGVLTITLAVQSVFAMVGIFFIRRWLVWPKSTHHVRQLVQFAAPYGAICCAAAVLPSFERVIVSRFLGPDELGLYAAGTKIAMLIALLTQAFQTAWGPFYLSIYKNATAQTTYDQVFRAWSVVVCLAALVLATIAEPVIRRLFTDKYAGAASLVFPLVMGLAIQAIGWVSEIGIGLSKRSHLSLYGYVVSVVVAVGSTLYLTPRLGLMGVAYGVIAGHLAKTITASWLASRAYPLSWSFGRVSTVVAATLSVGAASLALVSRQQIGAGIAAAAVGAVFLIWLSWQFVLHPEERQAVLAWRARSSPGFSK